VMCVACGMVVLGAGFGCKGSKPQAAAGDPVGPGGILSGPCAPDGSTHICSTDLGTPHGGPGCLAGVPTCESGVWGRCTGSRTLSASVSGGDLRSTKMSSSSTPDLHTLSGPPTSDASGCALNPCDPDCMGFDEDAGGTCTATTIYSGTLGSTGLPNNVM